jgi:hypothetical protein
VLRFGMIACVMVIPFAVIASTVRGIPCGWQLATSLPRSEHPFDR